MLSRYGWGDVVCWLNNRSGLFYSSMRIFKGSGDGTFDDLIDSFKPAFYALNVPAIR